MKKMIKSKILSSQEDKTINKFNNNFTIMFHLEIGKNYKVDAKKKKHKTSFYYNIVDSKPSHDHLIFKFNKNFLLIYNDVRKFGFIKILQTKKINSNLHIKSLGPEPLSKKFNLYYFLKNIEKIKNYLKDLLMNQKFISGLGNIYVMRQFF